MQFPKGKIDEICGIGLRYPHYFEILEKKPQIGWLEVHSENFFHDGIELDTLKKISKYYPISLHNTGLSLGSSEGINLNHLKQIKSLCNTLQPCFVSDHLSWSNINDKYLPDLLPLPYSEETMKIFDKNIAIVQDTLQREILIENPSSYLEYIDSEYDEIEFLVKLCIKSGAKILLDINNIFVSCQNNNWDMHEYINKIPNDLVKEIHIAGHTVKRDEEGEKIYIDTHDSFVSEEVWRLYKYAIHKLGLIHTLLEWDANIPSLETLITSVKKIHKII